MINQPIRRARKSTIVEILQMLVQIALVFVVVSAVVGRFVIHQTSMEPNFHEGQRVIVNKWSSLWSELFVGTAHAAGKSAQPSLGFKRGQIAVFYDKAQHGDDPLIKRVVALPGDTIEIRDNSVFVNHQRVREPYINGETTSCNEVCGPLTLGADEYFLLGDNRVVSRDSRSFGPVHADQFVGRVVLRYWPLDDLMLYP